MKSGKTLSPSASFFQSATAWILVSLITFSLFCIGFFIFWPLSLLFQKASGQLPHAVTQLWARLILRLLPFSKVRVQGFERIQKGKTYVIVSNHQSLLDILIVSAKLPLHFKFIAKRELFWIPFLGWHLYLARYIALRRGDPASGRTCLEKAGYWLKRNVSVLFFPEGTRSPDGEIHPFKAGAFKLAIETRTDILPLVVSGTREAVPKKSWRIKREVPLSLYALEPISVKGMGLNDVDRLRNDVRNKIISQFRR